MKMGTIAWPWRYDAVLDVTLPPTNVRFPHRRRYAGLGAEARHGSMPDRSGPISVVSMPNSYAASSREYSLSNVTIG
jgi:hypothetical protein